MSGLALFGAIVVFSTIGIAIVCLLLYSRILKKRHYKCPYCGQRFKVPATRSFFSKSQGVDKLLTCPNCGKAGFMHFEHDDDSAKDGQDDGEDHVESEKPGPSDE